MSTADLREAADIATLAQNAQGTSNTICVNAGVQQVGGGEGGGGWGALSNRSSYTPNTYTDRQTRGMPSRVRP